ncbi:hypothetical protein OG875_11345 [Streptomyces sp. NBC_01498]|uniref:hypothetical protein n=1 Tax=Streptomyces sp. NBC_01498 TaxID=2975870 RepID=UPI002E7B61A3|nr:hypothetical protein [Streptomyces sp. NBC_01498]WTL25137.1 hypothetical protein OG875_11345 [Streptomyces sp. NBC_01498]
MPFTRHWALEVPALELASLAAEARDPHRLRARRGYLNDSSRTLALAQLLKTAPRDFGAVGTIVLGADSVSPVPGPAPFAAQLRLNGVECIDGLQRLRIIDEAIESCQIDLLEESVFRIDVFTETERARARRLHDRADEFVNGRNAQDRLVSCPNITRLMNANWERGSFNPLRGVSSGPHAVPYTMAEVTMALACISGDGPDLAHTASTPEGLEALWNDQSSGAYRALFHAGMEPVGVVRAIEARRAARDALATLPLSRSTRGHGRLLQYAPELIIWAACRILPRKELHDPTSVFPWDEMNRSEVGSAAITAAEELVERYRRIEPGQHMYCMKAPLLTLWHHLVR